MYRDTNNIVCVQTTIYYPLKKKLCLVLAALCGLTGTSNIFAQASLEVVKARFEPFGIKEGLSQGFVSCITQDKDGFLWFTTKDGLDKYDGYHVTVYRNNPADSFSLPDNHVTQIVEDDKGNMWVGTDTKGLCLFDRRNDRFYPVKLGTAPEDTLINNGVEYLHYRDGKLLVTTANDVCLYDARMNGPYRYNGKNPLVVKKLFSYNSLQKPNRRWYGAIREAFKWMPDNTVWAPFADSVFIFTPDAGMRHWAVKIMPVSAFAMQGQIQYFTYPVNGNKIVFSGSNTISLYNVANHTIEYKKTYGDSGLAGANLIWNNTFTDNSGNVYFAGPGSYYSLNTSSYQLKKYEQADFSSKGEFSGTCQFVDRDGAIWVGSSGNGVYKYNATGSHFNIYPESAWAFYEDKRQNFYTSFRSGTFTFDPGTKAKTNFIPPALLTKGATVGFITCKDDNDRFWVWCNSGPPLHTLQLMLYDEHAQTLQEHTTLVPPKQYVPYMFTDAGNDLWMLGNGADNSRKLRHVDGKTLLVKKDYNFPIKNDLSTQYRFISGFWQDKKGVFWFGTLQGLFRFDEAKQTWKQFKNNPADTTSLSTDMVFSVCADPTEPEKYLWVGTNGRGFNRFELATGKCKRYTDRNGLPNNVVYGILSDELGNLWLSTNRGLSCFNIKNETFRNFTSEDGLPGDEFNRYEFLKTSKGQLFFGGVDGITVLTGLTVYNKPVDYHVNGTIINQPVQYAKAITLPYEKNMFTLEFAMLKYITPNKKHYRYRLDGFDKDWIDNGPKNTATFTNLDPKTYTFRVQSIEEGEIWDSPETTITVIIKAPWYGTWLFRVILFFVVAVFLYGLYRYRLHQTLKVIKMRNKIAGDLHDEIGSTLSSITVYSEIIETTVTDNELKAIAGRISSSSRNTLLAMDDIVWSINPKNDRFDNVLLRMRSFSREILSVQNCLVHFEAGDTLESIKLRMNERKNFYLIFKEAINNAVKYAEANNVWVCIQLKNNHIHFALKDDGKGFNMQDHKEGNGLESMARRAKELGGKLVIETAPGKGTAIFLQFPAK
jgi:ligand-binding sensor domain-containing protein